MLSSRFGHGGGQRRELIFVYNLFDRLMVVFGVAYLKMFKFTFIFDTSTIRKPATVPTDMQWSAPVRPSISELDIPARDLNRLGM